MAEQKRTRKLNSKTSRKELEAGKRHQEILAPKQALCYRRPENGSAGSWSARSYMGDGAVKRIGTADDYNDADGATVFSYYQATVHAKEWFAEQAKISRVKHSGCQLVDFEQFTVGDCIKLHFVEKERPQAKNAKTLPIAKQVINRWVTLPVGDNPPLGSVLLRDLTSKVLKDWYDSLIMSGRRVGNKAAPPPKTEEDFRKRTITANRTLAMVRAALNYCYDKSDFSEAIASEILPTWKRVKPIPDTDRARDRVLDTDSGEHIALIHAIDDSDFRDLVRAGLLTGCRYGELCKLKVGDYYPSKKADGIFKGQIHIADSKSGKPRDVLLTAEGAALFNRLVHGRDKSDLMFTHKVKRLSRKSGVDGAWLPSDQKFHMKKACEKAGIPKVVFYDLRHTYATLLFEQGVDLVTVARLMGHANTRMLEKHYLKVREKHIAETLERTYKPTGILDEPEPAKIQNFKPA